MKIYVQFVSDPEVVSRLDRMEKMLAAFIQYETRSDERILQMANETQRLIDELKANVQEDTDATHALTTYVTTLLEQIEENKDDPVQLQAILDAHKQNTAKLVAATLQDTPADPEAPQDPVDPPAEPQPSERRGRR